MNRFALFSAGLPSAALPSVAPPSAALSSAASLSAALRSAALAALVAAPLLGCDDMDRFSTTADESYCGSITLGSAFRAGFSPRVQMRLSLDAALLDGPDSPGSLSTFESASDDTPERRIFDDAGLRVIPPMAHDPLSRLEFGEGRERNAIYAVSPADPAAESVIAVVSLRSDDKVEVRLLRAGVAAPPDASVPEGRRPLFGIFPLSRQAGKCGF